MKLNGDGMKNECEVCMLHHNSALPLYKGIFNWAQHSHWFPLILFTRLSN